MRVSRRKLLRLALALVVAFSLLLSLDRIAMNLNYNYQSDRSDFVTLATVGEYRIGVVPFIYFGSTDAPIHHWSERSRWARSTDDYAVEFNDRYRFLWLNAERSYVVHYPKPKVPYRYTGPRYFRLRT